MSVIEDKKGAELTSLLASNTLFGTSSAEALQEIASLLKPMEFAAGEPIFVENEVCNHIYFIAKGSVETVKYDPRARQIVRLQVLREGEQLAEISALTRVNHGNSCFALEPCKIYTLDYQLFIGVLHAHPEIARQVVLMLSQLNLKLTNSEGYVEYFREADMYFRPEMVGLLARDLIDTFEVLPVRLDGNLLVLAMIDPYNVKFFSLFSRLNPRVKIKVTAIRAKDFEKVKKYISACYLDGEARALEPEARSAKKPSNETSLRELLGATSIFSKLPEKILEQLIPLFTSREFSAGEVIFDRGQPSDKFFLIQEGSIGLSRISSSGVNMEVSRLGANDSIGEISLLTETHYSLRAHAITRVRAHCLPKPVFLQLLKAPIVSIPLAKVLAERVQALTRMNQIRFYSGSLQVTPTMTSGILPFSVILENKVLPIEIKDNELTLGMVNPDDTGIFSALVARYLSNYRINIYAIRGVDFDQLLKTLKSEFQPAAPPDLFAGSDLVDEVEEASTRIDVINNVNSIIWDAISRRASDIHFEPLEREATIRLRIDGDLVESSARIDHETFRALTNRIKVMAKMDIGEKRLPQDGMLDLEVQGVRVYGRVSCVPSVFGENSVIRLVSGQQSPRPLRMLAPDKRVVSFFRSVVQHRQGVFLITGPTGSGKTSTLYSAIREINTIDRKIITIEDPVEIVVAGITQISIHEKIGLGFDKVLKYVLRQDPDVILVGEIRDKISAQFVFEAALTGHLVFSTLHTNSSTDIVPRLVELGVSQSFMASALVGVMAQRLLPAICQKCKELRPSTALERSTLKRVLGLVAPPRKLAYGPGCDACRQTGFSDRIPIFEYWRNSRAVRTSLYEGGQVRDLDGPLSAQNFRTLEQFGMEMVLNGLTTVDQVSQTLYGFEEDPQTEKAAA